MGAGPVVRLSPPPAGSGSGGGSHGGGTDVPVPGAARQPVYSDRMGNNDVFAVIADKTRRGILAALKDGERPVGDLVAELGVSQPTVSKHLKILREAGMVSMEAQGQRRLYAVQPEPLAEVTAWVHEVVGGAAHQPDAVHQGAQIADIERGLVAVETDIGQRALRTFLGRPRQDRLELGVRHAHEALGSGWCHQDPPSAAQPTLQPRKDVLSAAK